MNILSKKSSQEQAAAKKKIKDLKKRKSGLNRTIAGKISFEEQTLSKNCKIFSKKKGQKAKSLKLGLKGEPYKVASHNQKWFKTLVDKKWLMYQNLALNRTAKGCVPSARVKHLVC